VKQIAKKEKIYTFLTLLLLLGLSSQLDLLFSSYFYPFPETDLLKAIYIAGPLPGWIVVIASSIGLCIPKYKQFRRIFIYLIATLAIGSGLIVHAALKENWGRPRPKQVLEFGGKELFRPFYKPNFEETLDKHRSFASGHVTMGFFFFTFYFIGRKRHNRALQWFGIGCSFFLGFLLSYARIAQGGHFLSDAVGSLIVMYLTAYFLSPLLIDERSHAKAS
jgi:membrane-associated PAP2 superfamily phosphatase